MAYEFSDEELRMLAKINREMDEGIQPFVLHQGSRVAVSPEILTHFELLPGQTIDGAIFTGILKFNIANCAAKQDALILDADIIEVTE